jgi:hypothetical protein
VWRDCVSGDNSVAFYVPLLEYPQPEACPADHVFNIPWMKGPRREEALARFEVAATQKKAKLIGGRTQVRGGLLDCLGEIKILLALETIKQRGPTQRLLARQC